MDDTINVRLAPGWRTIDAAELPPGILETVIEPAGDTLRYIAAAVPARPSYAPNLVVVRARLTPDQERNPDEALAVSGRALADSIPGMRMIDDFPMVGSEDGRWIHSGIYILDEDALTVLQFAWLHRSAEGTSMWTATFTCTTREFGSLLEHFMDMSETLEVEA